MSLKARFEVTNVGHMCNKKTSPALYAILYHLMKTTASALCASVCDLQTQGLAVIHQQDALIPVLSLVKNSAKEYTEKAFRPQKS